MPDEPAKQLLPSGVMAGNPIDTTVEGELPEGQVEAFGLILPRRMRIVAQMNDAVFVEGQLRLEHVSNFIRRRVDSDQIETGPSKTVFAEARVKAAPKNVVEVEVSIVARGVRVIVRNKTRKAAEEGLTEAERWKRAGLTPDGKRPLKNLE
jgi:hypothetical protein